MNSKSAGGQRNHILPILPLIFSSSPRFFGFGFTFTPHFRHFHLPRGRRTTPPASTAAAATEESPRGVVMCPPSCAVKTYIRHRAERAASIRTRAEENGTAEDMCRLAHCYRRGEEGLEQDYALAAAWYLRSADKGWPEAQRCLGDRAMKSHSYFTAAAWYRKAALNGDVPAQGALGTLHFFGNGVEENFSEAMKWYRKAIAGSGCKGCQPSGHPGCRATGRATGVAAGGAGGRASGTAAGSDIEILEAKGRLQHQRPR